MNARATQWAISVFFTLASNSLSITLVHAQTGLTPSVEQQRQKQKGVAERNPGLRRSVAESSRRNGFEAATGTYIIAVQHETTQKYNILESLLSERFRMVLPDSLEAGVLSVDLLTKATKVPSALSDDVRSKLRELIWLYTEALSDDPNFYKGADSASGLDIAKVLKSKYAPRLSYSKVVLDCDRNDRLCYAVRAMRWTRCATEQYLSAQDNNSQWTLEQALSGLIEDWDDALVGSIELNDSGPSKYCSDREHFGVVTGSH